MTDDRDGRPEGPDLSDVPTRQLPGAGAVGVEVAGHTDAGRVRAGNEDAFAVEPPTSALARAHGTLLLVSDGMGGHAAGEVASRLAVETIHDAFYRARGRAIGEALWDAIAAANATIYQHAQQEPEHSGMGCTIVACVIHGRELTVGHVGDSRGYLIRGGRIRRLTRDHSWVARQVDEGVLTPEQAEHHPNRSLLTRALGRHPTVEIDVARHQLEPGDLLLLCSDGLTTTVDDPEIEEVVLRLRPDAAVRHLIDLANQRGAPDNVTVVVAAIGGAAGAASDAAPTVVTPLGEATTRLSPGAGAAGPAPGPVGGAHGAVAGGAHAGSIDGAAQAGAAPLVLVPDEVVLPAREQPAERPRRGRWLLGAAAALAGLAGALVLLTIFPPGPVGEAEAPRAAEAPAPAGTRPAETAQAGRPSEATAGPAAAGPAAAPRAAGLPPPVPTGLPAPGAGTGAAAVPPGAGSIATPGTGTAATPSGGGAPIAVASPTATPGPGGAALAPTPTSTVPPTRTPTATPSPTATSTPTRAPDAAPVGPRDAPAGDAAPPAEGEPPPADEPPADGPATVDAPPEQPPAPAAAPPPQPPRRGLPSIPGIPIPREKDD